MYDRIEIFKAAFLILGFLALGFAGGCVWSNMKPVTCPAPWQTGWSV